MNMKMKLRMRMRMRMKMYMILSFNKCGKVFILHFACDCDPEQLLLLDFKSSKSFGR